MKPTWFFVLALGVSVWVHPALAGGQSPSHRTITVDMVNIEFRPAEIRLNPGDRIRFINMDPFEHSVFLVNTANPNVEIIPDTKVAAKGTYLTGPIQAKGVFTLYCTIHGGMKAKVSTTGSFEITEEMKRAVAAALPPEVKQGETLFWGKAQCSRCHQIGEKGDQTRGPNLEDIGLRAKSRAKDRGLDSATQYLIESVLRPGAYVVAGYVDDMEKTYRPPLNLTKKELVRIIAYLQSQGGKVDLWAIDFPDPARPQPEAALFPLQGDKEEGREFFFEEADCGSCHRVGDKGGGIGPELTHIGAYRDRAFFLREILDPNAVVAPGFRPIDLVLKPKADGTQESYSGVLVRETPEAYVVKLSDESIRTFSKSGVEKASKQSESPMPDFTEILTVRQLADLIAFLQSLK